ncbi:hypothetical protein cypCar_00016372, partial [Cyprinus carpio]
PVSVGPYGQTRASCFDRVKMGLHDGFLLWAWLQVPCLERFPVSGMNNSCFFRIVYYI